MGKDFFETAAVFPGGLVEAPGDSAARTPALARRDDGDVAAASGAPARRSLCLRDFFDFFSDVFFIEFPTRAKAVLSTIAPRVPALNFAQGGGEMMSGKITKK